MEESNSVLFSDPFMPWAPLCPNTTDSASYSWKDYLCMAEDFNAAPVSAFRHVPLFNIFEQITEDLKLEVPNRDYWEEASSIGGAFWVASVVKISGYKLLLHYCGISASDTSHDFWMNIGSRDLHPIGWCAKEGKPLVPPKKMTDKENQTFTAASDWKAFLVKRLTASKTLPANFQERILQSIAPSLRIGHVVEAMDRNQPAQYRFGEVTQVVGQRVCVKYLPVVVDAAKSADQTGAKRKPTSQHIVFRNIWCHVDSPMIRPYGWSHKIGATLYASSEELEKYRKKIQTFKFDANEATEDCFHEFHQSHLDDDPVHSPLCKKLRSQHNNTNPILTFEVGMKLEAIDIYNNYYTITPATVAKVFDKWNTVQITYDGTSDSLIVDDMSPFIFPIGYCETHNIELAKPEGYHKNFEWPEYLKETDSVGAPTILFKQSLLNKFNVNQKIEATDNVDPHLVCVATITEVKGRLIRVHYDGWTAEYDQWFDASSAEIYPVGYCELTGHLLEEPNVGDVVNASRRSEDATLSDGSKSKKNRTLFLPQRSRKL